MAEKLPTFLTDRPTFLATNFKGYFHHMDATMLPFNVLTYPSRNCSLPVGDKVIPDRGKKLLGQIFTENVGIIGNKEKFKNLGGVEMEVRAYRSQVGGQGDVVEILYNYEWIPLTESANPLPVGLHEFYFDEWFDTKLPNSIPNSVPSKNLPRLIWVNGLDKVFSWTGGVAEVTGFVPNTSISIDPSTTWRSLGFTEDANGDAFIIANGLAIQLSNPADLDTSTIAVTTTAGLNIGDVVTSKIEVDDAPMPFDMCRANKNYMFYGNWDNRDLFMSNNFNKEYDYRITLFQALQNDLILNLASPYTGTAESVYRIIIDTANPDINNQTYSGEGLNDARYNTSGYTALGNSLNVYKTVVVADYSLLVNGTGTFSIGEVVTSPTASARVVAIIANGPNWSIATELLSGEFTTGQTVTGTSSGVTGVIQGGGFGAFFQNWIQFFKNDAIQTITSGPVTGTTVPIFTSLTISLVDGLIIEFGNYNGHVVGDFWELEIRQGGADSFVWQKDGGALSAPVAITGANQTLADGVSVRFANQAGHSVGDFWNVTASPIVDRAWINFYYTLPVRKIGEGYIFRLPSNFWTMNNQEESMYVNTSYGEWSQVETNLSSELDREDVRLTPLKQTGASKVLYPYLTGHINNDLIFITVDKDVNTIGRVASMQIPQTTYLSDPVKLDFEASSFEFGSIKFFDDKVYFSSPTEGITHCYDTHRKYWQPPKTFPEVGILSIVGNELICHSHTRNQSFTMFAGEGAGDNGMSYEVSIRTPYTSVGDRWGKKNTNMTFCEGYIEGNPQLELSVILGVHGCGGIYTHAIEPYICTAPDRAPFGQGPFGSHPFGSDTGIIGSHFLEVNKAYAPILEYYQIALQMDCSAKNHSYQILSMGGNAIYANKGNNLLVNPSNLPENE